MLSNGVNQYHTIVTYADVSVTFGDSVSRAWIRFAAPMIAEEERRKRKRKEKRK
ncbi:hypothetical protein MF628_003626 [Paenibacillus polymyxa]|uniref:hypothetical protein n=1 Tax=Paenibacillus polymyxa TaxID=1406 RepID=UPI0020256F33|nr:hypothetical protein [Paenibacillus polymyxa]URJ43963.1 hypothetical protein MF628_003626 [Paenibacillus polymyxa]